METLTGYAKLDELRMSAASSPTGIIKVSIEDLNTIAEEIAAQQSLAPDAPPESCEHGNLRGKCPVEICSYSKHGGRR